MTTAATAPETPATRTERLRAGSTDRLEASLVGAGPHVEAVLDVGSTESGDLLLVLPLPAARLPDLLAVPGWPTAGEAVTVLVPLAQALARLHAAGVALTAAGPESVVLDAAGAACWRVPPDPVLLRRAGAAAFSRAVDDDRERFAGFAAALVERTGRRLPEETDPERLADALFEVADPCPVRLAPDAVLAAPAVPARLVAPPPQAWHEGSAGPAGALHEVLGRVRSAAAPLRAVRRRVWATAAGAVAALLLAVALLPSGHADAAGGASGRSGSPAAVAPRTPAAPVPRRGTATPVVPAGPVAPKALQGGPALTRLLAARADCAGSARCIAAVDVPGSPVDVADRLAARSGVDPVRAGGRPRVLSQGGGTVVADAGGAVVVAVRQADGWRLRDVVAEPPG